MRILFAPIYLSFISLLALAHPTTLAQTPRDEIPIGTEVIFKPEDTTGTGVTPDGKEIIVEFNDYDRWYLSKSSEEQMQWFDLVQALYKNKKIPSYVSFVQFMNIVMDNELTLKDFNGPTKGAIAAYKKASELKPQDADEYTERGTTRQDSGNYQGAIADFNKAIEIDPKHSSAYLHRAVIRLQLGDYQLALSDSNKAIQLDPQFAEAYFLLGTLKLKQKDYNGAVDAYTKAIKIYPQFALAYSLRGSAMQMSGDDKSACEDWKRAADLGNEDASKLMKNFCR